MSDQPSSTEAEGLEPLSGQGPKVFRGPQGERVTLLSVAPKEQRRVLIRFDGFDEGEWNGKVILHTHTSSGDGWQRREDWKSELMGRPTLVLKGDGGAPIEVRPMGSSKDYYVSFSESDSQNVHPYELINAYSKKA